MNAQKEMEGQREREGLELRECEKCFITVTIEIETGSISW